jgi:SAM-dependent methyltransferase
MQLSFIPTLDKTTALRRLDRLLVPGPVLDERLTSRIDRIERAFQSYAASYPLPLWGPGLAIDNEMRAVTESLFPLSEVAAVFDLVLRRGCRFSPLLSGSYLHSAATWLDLLQKLWPQLSQADPVPLLRRLALDADRRLNFLFALFLPQHFGGAFDRYPTQSQWISSWLEENSARLNGRIRVLDSACGSGEGTYGVAELLVEAGLAGRGCVVHGSTLEPIELFAAAHAFFPHDGRREHGYRARVAPLFGKSLELEFYLDEVGSETERERYDLVLCNGLLGGPMLNEPEESAAAVRALASRLAPGGVLLAADRFHAGWRQRVPESSLRAMLRENGLAPLEVSQGVAGSKPANG